MELHKVAPSRKVMSDGRGIRNNNNNMPLKMRLVNLNFANIPSQLKI